MGGHTVGKRSPADTLRNAIPLRVRLLLSSKGLLKSGDPARVRVGVEIPADNQRGSKRVPTLVAVGFGLGLFIFGTGFFAVQCQWTTNSPQSSGDRTFTISYCLEVPLPPPFPPYCQWLPYSIKWFAFDKPFGHADVDIDSWEKLTWVLDQYDQGMYVYNSHTLPFELTWTSFPYGLTTELLMFTDASQLHTQQATQYIDTYLEQGQCSPYYTGGPDDGSLCLHGKGLSHDLGPHGGKGIFIASLGGVCLCLGGDEVTLEWFVPPP